MVAKAHLSLAKMMVQSQILPKAKKAKTLHSIGTGPGGDTVMVIATPPPNKEEAAVSVAKYMVTKVPLGKRDKKGELDLLNEASWAIEARYDKQV